MLSINIVLVASLALHLLHRPYLKARAVLGPVPSAQAQWNNMEAGLLTAALCIVALTTAMVANEIHWACSESWVRLLDFGVRLVGTKSLQASPRSNSFCLVCTSLE